MLLWLNSSVFRDIALCSPVKVNWNPGDAYLLHLQSRRISQARNLHEAGSKHSEQIYVPPKRRMIFTRLHGGVSQNTEAFIAKGCENLKSYIVHEFEGIFTYFYVRFSLNESTYLWTAVYCAVGPRISRRSVVTNHRTQHSLIYASPPPFLFLPIVLTRGYWGLFPRGYSGRGVKLATHRHIVPRIRIRGITLPRPPPPLPNRFHGMDVQG
jgi:hypothetical protein